MTQIINPSRRGFLFGIGSALVAAPAIVRISSLMPVRQYPINHWRVESKPFLAYYSTDVEAELHRILSEEILREIDSEIVRTMRIPKEFML